MKRQLPKNQESQIKISKDVLRKLLLFKLENNFKNINDTIEYLLKQ